jgi:uncharacterized membrane protein (DUF106 family)
MIMIVVGLLLIAAAIFVIVTAVTAGGNSVAIELVNVDVEPAAWVVFVAGIVTGVIVLAGVAALVLGIRQIQAHNREIEELRRKVAMLEGGKPSTDPDDSANDGRTDQPFGQLRKSDHRSAPLP